MQRHFWDKGITIPRFHIATTWSMRALEHTSFTLVPIMKQAKQNNKQTCMAGEFSAESLPGK